MSAALLVSIHDISPLTLEASRRLVEQAAAAGVPGSALTLLVIPSHHGSAPLDAHPPAIRWLRGLVDEGATLCMHGCTHVMAGRPRTPVQWAWARVFARGQGELLLSDEADARQRLAFAREIFDRAGLSADGFVAPAWLMSAAARSVVRAAGFGFVEHMAGIDFEARLHARRLIGFGSLTAIEAALTGVHARWETARAPADTRLALHPQDLARASTIVAIDRTLSALLARLEPMSYRTFLWGRRGCESRRGGDEAGSVTPITCH